MGAFIHPPLPLFFLHQSFLKIRVSIEKKSSVQAGARFIIFSKIIPLFDVLHFCELHIIIFNIRYILNNFGAK